ncbi:MAG TPA: hypothetical protein VIP81_18160 [Chitinophaga sp.]
MAWVMGEGNMFEVSSSDAVKIKRDFPQALVFNNYAEVRSYWANLEKEDLAAKRTALIYG